jgi:diacylglycerol kinase (ATP)
MGMFSKLKNDNDTYEIEGKRMQETTESKVFTYSQEDWQGEKRQKILLFYNPFSGNGLFKNNLDNIIGQFQKRDLQVVPVRAAEGLVIEKAMEEMDTSMYRQIVVAGGDGTINVCVNAMVRNNIDLPLALFPSGTANDFASYFRIPGSIEEMVDIAMGDKYVEADVGVCNNRCFINVAALGSLVDVSQKTNPDLKNTLGVLAYYLKGVGEIISLKPIPIKLSTDTAVYEENMLFMLVMNGQSAGGFKKISPESEVNDGMLDVMLFREMPILELPYIFMRVLRGDHIKNPKILTFSTDHLTVESDVEVSTDVDGEYGEKLPLQFSVLHNRLKIFTPRGRESGTKE